MAEELADIQATEGAGIVDSTPIPEASTTTPERSAKPEKQSLRQTLEKSVETVREAEAKADKAGRLHASDGKFASKEKPDVAPKEAAPVETPTTVKDVQPDKPSTAVIGPPPGWSAESKAAFAALPDPVKQDILKRETEVSTGFKTKTDELKKYQEIEQALAPVRSTFQQAGVRSDAEAIKSLLGWEASFRNPQTRMQAFHNLARQYGINLNSPQSQAPDANGIPDQLRPVYDQLGPLTQQVSSIQGELQRSREEAVSATLSNFAKDKPHFDKVRVRMGQLIQAGIVQPNDLEGAYQQAIWADPEIRTALTKEQFDKQQAEALKNQTNRAQASRQAAISPSTRSPNSPVVNGAKPGKLSVRETIKASVKELQDQRA